MAKIDYLKLAKPLYFPSTKEPSIVEVPPLAFLMVDGSGDPNTAESYRQAIQALYSMAYTLKFMIKKSDPDQDYRVLPLEGLWWAEDMGDFLKGRKDRWSWTAMIRQPEPVTPELVAQACDQVARKKELPALEVLRFETFAEGLAAQIMHLGPYADEAPNIERLHAFIEEQGGTRSGRHHEIYLSDPNRTAPERLKTVIRQPFAMP